MNASKSNNIEFLGSAFGNSRAANNEPCQEPTVKAVLHTMHQRNTAAASAHIKPQRRFRNPRHRLISLGFVGHNYFSIAEVLNSTQRTVGCERRRPLGGMTRISSGKPARLTARIRCGFGGGHCPVQSTGVPGMRANWASETANVAISRFPSRSISASSRSKGMRPS